MTISTEAIKSSVFAGNGSTVDFAISFKTFSQSDLTVTLTSAAGVEAVKSLTTHYTVSLNANQDNSPGGTVTMGTPPASGEKLVIANEPEYTQSSDIVNGGGFFPNVIEDMVDRNTILARRAQELTSRSIKIPISDSTGTTVELPTETLRASKAIVFDANGNVGVSVDNYVDQVATVAASATSAASSASAASSSAASAASSASSASTSAAAAATSYDDFDDRFLGAKTSDPTVDNDGDALIDGALFFRTDQAVMKVYDLSSTTWLRTTPTSSDQTAINNVSSNASNINTVAGISSDVTTVAGVSSDVTTVAGIDTEVSTVSGNNANVSTVAGISGNVTTVAGISGNVTTVASNNANVTTVAGISSDVTTVAGNNANVSTVAGNNANVTTVAGSIANVNTTASNIADVNNFAEVYRIASADPTTSLNEGDLVFRTDTDTMRVYNGSAWQNVAPVSAVNVFGTLAVSGQSDIVADSTTDTLTFAGSNITITTDASTDTVTFTGPTPGASTGLAIAMAVAL